MSKTKELGAYGESLAAEYLLKKGYRIIGTNIRAGHKEIDLVCSFKDMIIFVEVKTVKSKIFGGADEIFSAKKTKNFKSAVLRFLSENKLRFHDLRLDLVYVDLSKKQPAISHYQDIS